MLSQVLTVAALGCREDATSPSGRAEPIVPALAVGATAGTLSFRQVDEGWEHACGVTTDDRAYCWGSNVVGQLGDGTTSQHQLPVPVAGPM